MGEPVHNRTAGSPHVVLFVLDTRAGAIGGTEVNSARCAKAVRDRGYRSVILEVGSPLLARSSYATDVELEHVDAPGLECPTVREWLAHFQRIRPDVIVLSKQWVERRSWKLDVAARLCGARYLAWEHHPAPRASTRADVCWPRLRAAKRQVFLWVRRQIHVNAVQRTVCVSRAVFEPLTTRWFVNPSRTETIYPGVDFASFRAQDRLRFESRQNWGVPPDATVLGTMGRLVPYKRNDLVLRAFAGLRGRRASVDLWLVIAGIGEDRARLEALALQLGVHDRVRFVGWQENVQAMWSAIDIFPLPSDEEGLGMTLIEAIASGCLSLSANVGGMPEVFAGGFEHLVVPNQTGDAWTDAIDTLIQMPSADRIQLQRALHSHLFERFDAERQWSAMVEWIVTHGSQTR